MRAPASANHHDIAFFTIGDEPPTPTAGQRTVGMYHVAWEVGTLDELIEMRDRLAAAGALVGASDHGVNKSLYCHDPDGLEFEVMWLVPPEHWGDQNTRRSSSPSTSKPTAPGSAHAPACSPTSPTGSGP